jgi:hypothetical protein
MKQIITIETSNVVNLEKYLEETKLSKPEINALTERGWNFILEVLRGYFSNDKIKVLSVETLSDRLN